jgi:hypothetical protein
MSATYFEFKRVENSRLSRERDHRRGRELLAIVAATVPVAAALLLYTSLHLQTVRVGYEIGRSRRILDELRVEQQKLVVRIEAATSPEKTVACAAAKSLKPAAPGQVILVGSGESR